jgi:hypothetical protein
MKNVIKEAINGAIAGNLMYLAMAGLITIVEIEG